MQDRLIICLQEQQVNESENQRKGAIHVLNVTGSSQVGIFFNDINNQYTEMQSTICVMNAGSFSAINGIFHDMSEKCTGESTRKDNSKYRTKIVNRAHPPRNSALHFGRLVLMNNHILSAMSIKVSACQVLETFLFIIHIM
ncbi:hypothetical protein CRM22_003548 [Opisthorchis felineus]|uniref:Uncharacterized protein n=1 Tax=Opisthorchis felineus TaxID=147828 RepID=A0A4V3SFU1_OPIFE|nr:hypothetical protein CRM22_003548 [Opisthorchis felineus]